MRKNLNNVFILLLKTINVWFLFLLIDASNAASRERIKKLENLPEPYKSINLKKGGCSGNQSSSLDIYRSSSSSSKTVLLLTGGGYMTLNSKKISDAGSLYLNAGYTMAVLYYRLCRSSEEKWWIICSDPYEAFEDVTLAIENIHTNLEEYHVDPEKVVISGFSAGGHLAALYSTLCTSKKTYCPSAMVLHFPFLEKGARIFCTEVGKPFGSTDSYESCHPTKLIDSNTPPTIIYHASGDTVVPVFQSQDFVKNLTSYGISNEYYEIPEYGHSLAPFDEVIALSVGIFSEGDTYAALLDRALSLTPTKVPSLLPSRSCIVCNDVGTRKMIKQGVGCTSIADKKLKKKCQTKKWKKKKTCLLSCYNAGHGYKGDICCNPSLSLDPTIVPTSLLTSRSCEVCDDSEPTWMINNGNDCTTSYNTIIKKCNKHSKWIDNKFCRLSCYNVGKGYDGDICCNDKALSVVPTMVPSLTPSSFSCEVCDDSEPEWMVNSGNDCTTSYNTIIKNCNKHSNWIDNKFCRLSCYNAKKGYEGDVCCNGN